MRKTVRILNLNVNRNLITHIQHLKLFIYNIDPDIVILTETGIKNDDEQKIIRNTINKYKWNFNNENYDKTNKRRKGTTVASKIETTFMPDEQMTTNLNDTNGRIQHVTILINKAVINVIAVYQTSGDANLEDYVETNLEIKEITKNINDDENLIIAGDFNASINRNKTKIDNEFIELLRETQTYSINHKYRPHVKTWFQRGVEKSAQTIDHIITRYADNIKIKKIKTMTPNFYTDHDALILEAKIFKAKKPSYQRNTLKIPNKQTKTQLKEIQIDANTPDEFQKQLYDKCKEICERTSRKKFQITENDKIKRRKKLTKIARKTIKMINNNQDWRIDDTVKITNRIKRLKITTDTTENDNTIIAKIRNKIINIESDINDLIKDIIIQNITHRKTKAINEKNSRKIYATIAPKQRNTQQMIAIRDEQNKIKTNKSDIEKICNAEITRNFTARTTPPKTIITKIINDTWDNNQDKIKYEIDYKAIYKTLNKKHKTPGKDEIRKEHLIEIMFNDKEPTQTLKNLTRTALSNDGWENTTRALICPIFKRGDQTIITNWRKITLLNETNKIIQTIVNTNIIKHAKHNNSISNLEFGFYPNRNAHQATQLLTNMIENTKYYREQITIATLDMTDAYGSAEHAIIEEMLDKININDETKQINNNIRKHTTFSMMTRHGITSPQMANRNLSQGAVDSPILFSLYTEPITQRALKSETGYQINKIIGNKSYDLNIPLTKYADDITTIANNANNMNKLHQNINETTDALGLMFSTPEKNKSIHIDYKTGTPKIINSKIQINDLITTQIKDNFVKYLGLYIQIKTAKTQIQKITLDKIRTAIKRIKFIQSVKTITNMMKSIPMAIAKYQWKTTIETDDFTNIIDKIILTNIKRKSGIPLTVRTALMRAPYE